MSSLQIRLLLPSLSISINQVMNRKLFHNTRKGVNKRIFTVTLLSAFLRKCIHNSKLMNCIKTIPAIIDVINYACNHTHKIAKMYFLGHKMLFNAAGFKLISFTNTQKSYNNCIFDWIQKLVDSLISRMCNGYK